tara:strand:- start:1633 stop:2184 length:552 start_codon:yes stop_codon:yes gene_type:complete
MAITRQGVEVFGVKEIQKMFEKLPKQIKNGEGKAWNAFWKETSKPMQRQAQINANAINSSKKGTGQLSRSIGFFSTRASRKAMGGYIGPRVRGRFAKKDQNYKGDNKKKMYSKSGFYGAWVEFGSEVKFGGKGFGENQPFMAPAFEATKSIVNANARKDANTVMERLINNHMKRTKKYGTLGY